MAHSRKMCERSYGVLPTAMEKRELAIQLYTLRNETAQDFPETLRQVADAGYSAVELAGFGSHTPADLRKVLDETGMVACGAHIGFNQLEWRLDAVIEEINTLGVQNLACPPLPQERGKTA